MQQHKVNHYVDLINGLHSRWTPHPGQIAIGQALLLNNILDIFVQAGRNFGKTELVCYLLWRWAQQHPGSENYYFGPYMKQSREIVWASNRLQTFGPREWIHKPNNTEMRIPFVNGSFIKCDGSENVEAYRGIKPRGLIVLDEFKDFRPEFYPAFNPNRAAHKAPMVIIGTPPDRDCQFTELAEWYKKEPDKQFFWSPTEMNPHIDKKELAKIKAELISRGEEDVWQREYMAMFVKGGVSKIFPMLTQDIVKPHEQIMTQLHRDRKRIEWLCIADPSAATCFGELFIAYNPYTKKISCVDEIYETDQARMTVKTIGQVMVEKKEDLHDTEDDWRNVYDEAATWFANEMTDHFDVYFEPTHKSLNDKEQGLTLIKDLILNGKLEMSDRCEKLYWEMDNYFKDKNGKIPKVNDHLIDCLRYGLGALNYHLTEEKEKKETDNENFRGARIEDDFPDMFDEDL